MSKNQEKTQELVFHTTANNLLEKNLVILRSRILTATQSYMNKTGVKEFKATVSTPSQMEQDNPGQKSKNNRHDNEELSLEDRASRYQAQTPLHSFDKLVFSEDFQKKIYFELKSLSALRELYGKWRFEVIKPISRRGLILAGKPGTGKTALVHAIAHALGKSILSVTHADIASKFHGEGDKNLEAVFSAAQKQNAVLHIEEGDSMSSERLGQVDCGGDQAINSLRNQLFSCLDRYPVTTIITTNFVESLDKALETRLRYINVPMPDEESRKKIFEKCLFYPGAVPIKEDLCLDELAKVDDVCGREIVDAVEDAALKAILQGKELNQDPKIEQAMLLAAIEDAKKRRFKDKKIRQLDEQEKNEYAQIINEDLAKKNSEVRDAA